MKKLLIFSALCMMVFTLAACGDDATETDTTGYTYTAIDINPSVEFVTDEDDIVITVYYANEDAEIVAADLDLIGLSLEDAIELYLEAAIETGYIEVNSNENIITITNQDEDKEDAVRAQVQAVLTERRIGAAIFGGEMNETYTDLADQYDIGYGRARLVSRVAELDDELTFEDALALSHADIMARLVEAHQEEMETFIATRQSEAEQTKLKMRNHMMNQVQAHQNEVANGTLETPNYSVIRNTIQSDLDQVRARIEARIEQTKHNAQTEE